MNVDCFLDTNVLVYAAMARFSAPGKYERARLVIADTNFGLSAQVLQEFFVKVTRGSDRPLSVADALVWLDRLIDRPCIAIDQELVIEAVAIAERYKIHYWDAYGSIRFENPFRIN